MRKRFLTALLLLLWAGAASAGSYHPRRFSLSLPVGGYAPSDSSYRRSYGGNGLMTGLRFSYTIKRRIDLDLTMELFLKNNIKDPTRITWFASSLTPSARYRFFSASRIQPYLGGGFSLVDLTGMYLFIDPSQGNILLAKVHHSGSGLVVLGGADVLLTDHIALFGEARYYSLRFKYDRYEMGSVSGTLNPPLVFNQSGGYFGGGLKYRF